MMKRHSPREILPAAIEVWITPGILRSQSFHESESKAENVTSWLGFAGISALCSDKILARISVPSAEAWNKDAAFLSGK